MMQTYKCFSINYTVFSHKPKNTDVFKKIFHDSVRILLFMQNTRLKTELLNIILPIFIYSNPLKTI